jgi:hypothetical protein
MNLKETNSHNAVCGNFARVCVLIIFFLAVSVSMWGQANTSDILGTVADPSGGVIPGAKVTLVNQDTKETRRLNTDGSGNFVFSPLTPGAYTLTVAMDGFQTLVTKDITVAAGDRRRADVGMKIGGSTEIVDVSATSAPALQTDSSVVASTVTERAVQDLPLAGRNFVALAQLQPGATEGSPTSFSSGTRPDDRRQGSSVAINGQPDVINNNLLDGLDNNEKLIGTIGARPSVEAIAEVRVLTNTFTADSGRAAGAVINVITKSGTNSFHGSLFEYYRNDKLNAFPWGSTTSTGVKNAKPKYHLNQFGGSFGGPIKKDKTFFFGDLEFFRQVKGNAPQTVQVPSVAAKSSFFGVPASERDSAAAFYLSLFPDPNGTCSNTTTTPSSNGQPNPSGGTYTVIPVSSFSGDTCQYTGSRINVQNSRLFDVRVDHHFNPKNTLFGRYSDNDVNTTFQTTPLPDVSTSAGTINPNSGFAGNAPQKARNVAITYTHMFTDKLLMQASAAYSYLNNASYPLNYDTPVNTKIGQPNVNSYSLAYGLAPAIISSLGTTLGNAGNFIPLQYKDNNYQLNGFVLYNQGKQSIKIGGAGIRRTGLLLQNSIGAGSWTFPSTVDFIRGYFSAQSVNINVQPPTIRTWEPSMFFQDDYRVATNLTLNLGVRYDIYTPNTEKHNYLANWDPYALVVRVAGKNSNNSGGVRTDYSNISPRLGFAYTVHDGTVIRGGFGIAFFPANIAAGYAMKGPPYIAAYGSCTSAQSDANATGCQSAYGRFRMGLPTPTPIDPLNPRGSLGSSIDPGFRSGYLEQYNLAVQQQFGANTITITYVGSQGRRLPVGAVQNNIIPVNGCTLTGGPVSLTSANATQPTGTCGTGIVGTPIALRPRPYVDPNNAALKTTPTNLANFGGTGVTTTMSEGASNFNSMQLLFERRFNHGLGANANYVYARALDNRPDPSGFTAGGTGQVASTRGRDDYGNSDIDIRHRISVLLNYAPQIPTSWTGWKKAVFGGYQVNMINVWATGTPNNVINGQSGQSACGANVICTQPNGAADRAQITGDYHISGHTPNNFFNTSVFHAQTLGTMSNQGRNQIYGPHFRHWDASLFRDIKITEHTTLQLRAEFFNLANQTNYYILAANMTVGNTANFGKLNQTTPQYSPRSLQFAAKFTF